VISRKGDRLYRLRHPERYRKSQRESARRHWKKWYRKNRQNYLARAAMQYALRTGKLIKPKRCNLCGKKRPLQGHHPDYRKRLEIVWACNDCHKEIHRKGL
jgi:hypothetical protein